ncbi:MAG: homoserine kinase [Gammaproteobacteria bacterium]|nr:homoserine kinase [Gammaproteobacteria bacterium]
MSTVTTTLPPATATSRSRNLAGIEGGVENSNYYLETDAGVYVLTIFERQSPEAAQFGLSFMNFLASGHFPVPRLIETKDNAITSSFQDKPVAIVSCMPGSHAQEPGVSQCAEVGTLLGRMHRAAENFSGARKSSFDSQWRQDTAAAVTVKLTDEQKRLLEQALRACTFPDEEALPDGVIHGDVFRDNVLFERGAISGIVDFYYAASGAFVYDLAIAINDWCSDAGGELDMDRVVAMCNAYQGERVLTKSEHDVLDQMLVLGAVRFWLSRLHDHYFPRSGEKPLIKDPKEFELRLANRLNRLSV